VRIALDYQDKTLLRCWGNGTGEIAYAKLALRGPQIVVETPSDWHEHRRAWVRLGFGLFTLAFSFSWPWKVPPDDGQCSGPTFGFAFHDAMLWIYTGKSTGRKGAWITFKMPWDWRFQEHVILTDPEAHPYRYVLRSGKVQERTATIKVETRRWTRPWIPRVLFKKTIDVNFDDEVGERSGSWKGGTIGCGYDMLPGELPVDTLRRMERERKF
jgi:hypothetical protein